MDIVVQSTNQQELHLPHLSKLQVFNFQIFKLQVFNCNYKQVMMCRGNYDQVGSQDVTIHKDNSKPKEISFKATPQPALPKAELPKIELPNDENKLFDEADAQATSTIPDLSIGPEEEKDTSLTGVWDQAMDTLFELSAFHPDGRSLKQWVHNQNMATMEQFFQWDESKLAVGEFSTSR